MRVVMRFHAADETLDHHDRRVDDEAEVERAEAHEIGRIAEQRHADERHQHGNRNDRGDDQGGAHVPQEQEEHGDDEQPSLHQVFHDRARGARHQIGLIVERRDRHPGRQRPLNLRHPRADPRDDIARVGTLQLEHHPAHHLFLAIVRHGAIAWQRPEHDRGHVAHPHGRPVRRAHLHAEHIVRALDAPEAAQGVAFPALFEIAATEGERVPGERVMYVGHGETARRKLGRVDDHLDPLREPPPRVHLGHTRHGAQPRADGVVVQRLQFGQRERVAGEHVLVQLSHRGRDGAERGFHAGGQCPLGVVEPLLHELPREVHVDIVGERHRDQREAKLRDRPHPFGVGDPHERRLDGIRDQPLHFLRRHPGGHRDHFDARPRQVGEGVEGDVLQRIQPRGHERQRGADDDAPPVQRKMNQCLHRIILRPGIGA